MSPERGKRGNVSQANPRTKLVTDVEEGAATLSVMAARVGERLGETAQQIDEVARSTCLLALDVAVEADRPGHLGQGLSAASRQVRQLAQRTHRTLADLEAMLKAVEGRTA
jgi:methyl-accepting chemotaxis protein